MNKRATNDEHTLSKLGYKQELRRKLTFFHNFAVTFSYLSPITGRCSCGSSTSSSSSAASWCWASCMAPNHLVSPKTDACMCCDVTIPPNSICAR